MNETPFPDQPLDIQHDPDPAQEQPVARRVPNLGHTVLYLALNVFCITLCQLIALVIVHGTSPEVIAQHKVAMLVGQVVAYVVVYAISVALFPMFWKRSFADGISWNLRAMRLNWWKLMLVGALLSGIAQLAMKFLPQPDSNYLLDFFSTTSRAWATIALVSILPPIAEEIAFRGFLLPSLATAYDWLTLERSPAGLARWQQTTTHTRAGWVFAAFFSSIAFAALHGSEYSWSTGSMAVLFVASIVLSVVRIRTRSVAASALAHIFYNTVPLASVIVITGGLRHLDKLN